MQASRILTGCDVAIFHILLEIANLSRHIEQQTDRTLEFKHLTVQAQIVFGAFRIGPHLVRRSIGISVEFRIFQT